MQPASCGFPIQSVKGHDFRLDTLRVIKETPVDAPRIRVRTRLIKAFGSAVAAEKMLRGSSSKAIGCEGRLPLCEGEIVMGDDKMEVARFAADRTIAVEHLGSDRHADVEADRTAMASAPHFRMR